MLYNILYDKERGSPMTHATYTDFRQHLARYMDAVTNDRTPLHVTRHGSRSSIVVISESEYDSMMETLHLLRSPANAARLTKALADADAGNLVEHELIR